MSGICGWLGETLEDSADPQLQRMVAPLNVSGQGRIATLNGHNYALAVISYTDSAALTKDSDLVIALEGRPYVDNLTMAQNDDLDRVARTLLEQFRNRGADMLKSVKGGFSAVILDLTKQEAILAIDRIGIRPMAYTATPSGLVFGSSTDSVRSHAGVKTTLDQQAIFDYLYFSMIPSPRTIYREINKLEPAHYLRFRQQGAATHCYWKPHFRHSSKSLPRLSEELRHILEQAVQHNDTACSSGAFLSGGLDSSTVCGVHATVCKSPTKAYSIGFDAKGYDEIEYARIAVNHFKLEPHEYYVTPQDVADAVPLVASMYDEPFGNSSALPAYYCGKIAKEDGVNVLLAGDGGDEIFAGNTRYAKQKIFEHYYKIPALFRKGILEPTMTRLPGVGKIPPLRKIQSYIKQARIPLPERLETYNFLHMVALDEIFNPDFLGHIDGQHPVREMRKTYNSIKNCTTLDRMLYLDWKYTLADNDLRKVNRMCETSGIEVRYPMLDSKLVDFSARIPDRLKLKGVSLRYFYKQALKDFLPKEIIDKPKHGFGLPFGVWLKTSPDLQELLRESINSFKGRGYLRPAYIDWLMQQHQQEHAGFYGTMLWMLMILELWLAAHT